MLFRSVCSSSTDTPTLNENPRRKCLGRESELICHSSPRRSSEWLFSSLSKAMVVLRGVGENGYSSFSPLCVTEMGRGHLCRWCCTIAIAMIISIGIRDLCQGLLLFLAFFLFLFSYFYVVRYRVDVAFPQARTEAKERKDAGAQDIFPLLSVLATERNCLRSIFYKCDLFSGSGSTNKQTTEQESERATEDILSRDISQHNNN